MPPAPLGRLSSAAQLATDNRSPAIDVVRWFQPETDYLRWDQSFPYQLLVVRREHGGSWRQLDDWQFTLPIPPRSLRIQTPIPTDLILNEDGAVEITNDIRLRVISLQGTTGVLPLRPAARYAPFSRAQTIIAGVASRNFADNVASRGAEAQRYLPPSVVTDDQILGDVGKVSGYAQFLELEKFIERYHAFKKTKDGRECRLALAVWKSQHVWLLTLQSFDLARVIPDVYSYPYSIVGRSDGRISLDAAPAAFQGPAPLSADPKTLASTLRTMNAVRSALAQRADLIGSASGNFSTLVNEPARSISLALRDLSGVSASLADLPRSIVAASKAAVVSLIASRAGSDAIPSGLARAAAMGSEVERVRALGALLARSDTRTAALLSSGALANLPANDIFANPEKHHEFFVGIKPGDLQLPLAVSAAISAERARVAAVTAEEYSRQRAGVQLAADKLAAMVGLSSPTYEATIGLELPPAQRAATDDDFQSLFALNQLAMTLDLMAARAPRQVDATAAAMEYVSGLASDAGMSVEVPRSKLAVPFPAGMTLQQVSAMYLPNTDLDDGAQELATLNNLREPFVDEIGRAISILAPPTGKTVTIGEDGAGLVAGQQVVLSARSQPDLSAIVLSLSRVGGSWLVGLSVDASGYAPSQGGYLRVFAPGTIRGGQILWIPSQEDPSEDDFDVLDPSTPADQLPLLKISGTDLLLDQNGDIVITPDGDFLYARGLALVTQAVRVAIGTPRGALLRHPSFGLREVVGLRTGDFDLKDVTKSIQETFADDPLFRSVDAVAVSQDGPTIDVATTLSVAGSNRPVPVSVQLRQI